MTLLAIIFLHTREQQKQSTLHPMHHAMKPHLFHLYPREQFEEACVIFGLRNIACGDNILAYSAKLVNYIISAVLARIIDKIFLIGTLPTEINVAKVRQLCKSKGKEN